MNINQALDVLSGLCLGDAGASNALAVVRARLDVLLAALDEQREMSADLARGLTLEMERSTALNGIIRNNAWSSKTTIGRLEHECDSLGAKVAQWQLASGLERGGDPDGVTPDAMRAYWEEQERELALCKEALRGLLRILDSCVYWPGDGRDMTVEDGAAVGLARGLVEK